MRLVHTRRWEADSAERLRAAAACQLPGERGAVRSVRTFHRDLYFDTPDGTLRRRGVVCRFRIASDDRRTLALEFAPAAGDAALERSEAPIDGIDPVAALHGTNAVARRLRGIVDPAQLHQTLELAVERLTRRIGGGWPWSARVHVHFDSVTVRRGESVRVFHQVCAHAPPALAGMLADLAEPFELAGLHAATMSRTERAELLMKWMPVRQSDPEQREPSPTKPIADAPDGALNPELSFLAWQQRVLELAADPATPLGERLRFLAIAAANLDEFFAIRVAGLKVASAEQAEESLLDGGPRRSLAVIAGAVRRFVVMQQRVAAEALACATGVGSPLRPWRSLSQADILRLTSAYEHEVHAALTPLAMTLSPGHPIPHLATLTLSIAVLLRDRLTGARHLAQVEVPDSMDRFVPIGAPEEGVVLVEELIRHHLDRLYPSHVVEEARCFRVTRGGDLAVDEENTRDLLEAIDDATRRRLENAVVRLEVEAGMSPVLRDLLIEELHRETRGAPTSLGPEDVYDVEGPLDLRALGRLPLPDDARHRYAPFTPADPAADAPALLDAIAVRDLLVHHPFESFDRSVLRFIQEASEDDAVTAIKMTLYRAGDRSPVVEALRTAARAGKQVHCFVELRARFDEARNVKWVRALEKAGVHVIYGLRGVKTHAKAALVLRREGSRLRRYAHVGTGNYNPGTALAYTDFSLFTADESLTSDVADLFNALTGSSVPAITARRGALISPAQLLPALLERIRREREHAQAGRDARILIKVNGLSDPEVVQALLDAAAAGVQVDLLVRSICTLRPADDPRSRVRVVANAGRFLEHSRVFHFANGGDPEWFLGSADLRPRNLRRRVELLVPVRDPALRATLAGALRLYLEDPRAWDLRPSGEYVRRQGRGAAAQEVLLEAAAGGGAAKSMNAHALDESGLVDLARNAD